MIEVIKNFFESQWGGMLGGLLTSAFIALLKILFDYIATTKNEYSGSWIDAVYDQKNEKIVKVDIWKLRYNNHTKKVKGNVLRYYGKGKGEKWKCVGQILEGTFYLIYEGLGAYFQHNGCVVAKVKDTPTEQFRMQTNGNYIKMTQEQGIQFVKIIFYKLSKENLKFIKIQGIDSFLNSIAPYKGKLGKESKIN